MYGKILVLLICCIVIGSAVGSYVDHDRPVQIQYAQNQLDYDAGLIRSCMTEARTELDRLDPRIVYYERDLHRACRETVIGGHFSRN